MKENPEYEKAEYDVKLEPANTIHVGPPPIAVALDKCWNGEPNHSEAFKKFLSLKYEDAIRSNTD